MSKLIIYDALKGMTQDILKLLTYKDSKKLGIKGENWTYVARMLRNFNTNESCVKHDSNIPPRKDSLDG